MRSPISVAFVRVLQVMAVFGWLLSFGLSARAVDDLSSRLIWGVQLGGGGDVQPKQLVTDLTGNTYVCGAFSGALSIGTNRFTSAGDNDAFVAKFDALGDLSWARTFGSKGLDVASAIALATDGTVTVAGAFAQSIQIDGVILTAAAPSDWFAAKFREDGTLVWARQGGSTYSYATGISTDQQRNVFVGKVTTQGRQQLVKLDSEGQVQWTVTGFGNRPFGSDAAGNVYSIEQFGFVSKITRDGTIVFSIVPTAQNTNATAICGSVTGGVVLVGGQLAAGDGQLYVGEFDLNGSALNSFVGSDGNAAVTGIAQTPTGFVVAGHTSQFFVRTFNPSGKLIASSEWGPYSDSGIGIGQDGSQNSYVATAFAGVIRIGTNSFTSQGGRDALLLKFERGTTDNPPPVVTIKLPADGSAFDQGEEIKVVVDALDDSAIFDVTLVVDGIEGVTKTVPPYEFVVRFFDERNHTITARARDDLGEPNVATPITIKSGLRPLLVRSPKPLTAPGGSAVMFSGHFDGGNGGVPLSYQWFKAEEAIGGAKASTLILTNVTSGDAGSYSLRATNLFGVAVTDGAQLTVTNAPEQFVTITIGGTSLAPSQTEMTFTDDAIVAMQSVFDDGLIFFTTDGTAPDFTSRFYSGAFPIRSSLIVRAVTYNGDLSIWAERPAVTLTRADSAYTLETSAGGAGVVSRDVMAANNRYASNTLVRVTATPADGWTFLGWSGDSLEMTAQIAVTMGRSQSLQANFGTPLTLRVSGSGDVVANPSAGLYPYGSRVRLAAIPEVGSYFALWGGAAAGLTNNPLELQITNARPVVSALFAPLPGGQVALSVKETGEGTVTVTPPGNRFAQGTVVTLNAVAKGGQRFLGWSGDAGGTNNPLSVTLTSSKTITAQFTANQFMSITRSSLRDARSVTVHVQSPLGAPFRMDSSVDLRSWTQFLQTNALGSFDYSEAMTNGTVRFFELR